MEINKSLPAKSISYGTTRKDEDIKYIVLHFTGNRTDTAKANCNYFSANGDNKRSAGAHYFVDKTSVWQSIADNRCAYAVGGSKQSQTGGTCFQKCTNANSISIEMCSNDGAIASETIENARWLTMELMERYNVPIENVIRHWDVNGKACPGWSGWINYDQSKWEAFKASLVKDGSIRCGDVVEVDASKIKIVDTSASGDKVLLGYLYKGAKVTILKLNKTGSMAKIADGVWIYTRHVKLA